MPILRRVLERVCRARGWRIVADDGGVAKHPPDFTPAETATLAAVSPFSMTSPERLVALVRAVEHVVANRVAGDIVECGVWRGGSMMAVARTLLAAGDTSRMLHLFDTYEGMPPPTAADVAVDGTTAAHALAVGERATSDVWAVASFEDVERNVLSTGYPQERVRFVRGKVEDTVPANAPERIALLRLDTDWYESTKHEMDHLWPRLVPGGVLILDDYGHWGGARKAVDEYVAAKRIPLLLCRIDYTGRIAVKPHG